MNTKLRTEAKNDFEKGFFKLMNNSAFGKTMNNVRKHRDITLVTNNRSKKKSVGIRAYLSYNKNTFQNTYLAIGMKKIKVKMNKLIYLGMSILDISKH